MGRIAEAVRGWFLNRIADPEFQARATANPLMRPFANREGARLYDLVAGFVYSQTLLACVERDLFRLLKPGPMGMAAIAARIGLPPPGAKRLLRAAAALDLVKALPGDRFALGPLGAAVLGAPGVEEMIRHHPMFYRDIADPLALLDGSQRSTELSRFWSYVRPGSDSAADPERAAAYSRLMAVSQRMVADETLAVAPLSDVRLLMDVGGGEGAFLAAALAAAPDMRGRVFDLPDVAALARRRLDGLGLSDRAEAVPGSFLTDEIPAGADAISLVRVLYDHDDPTARNLLRKVHRALPPGGLLLVSEPMSGGDRPTRAGDAYFGFYTAAMTSGTPRSPDEHAALLAEAGFADIRTLRPRQPFITRVMTARKPRQRI